MISGGSQQADQVDDLDHSGFSAGTSRVLERIADGIPFHAGLVGGRPLAAEMPILDVFLALSSAPPAMAMNTAINWPLRTTPARNAPSALTSKTMSHQQRQGDREGHQADQLFLCGSRGDAHHLAIVGRLGAFQHAGDLNCLRTSATTSWRRGPPRAEKRPRR